MAAIYFAPWDSLENIESLVEDFEEIAKGTYPIYSFLLYTEAHTNIHEYMKLNIMNLHEMSGEDCLIFLLDRPELSDRDYLHFILESRKYDIDEKKTAYYDEFLYFCASYGEKFKALQRDKTYDEFIESRINLEKETEKELKALAEKHGIKTNQAFKLELMQELVPHVKGHGYAWKKPNLAVSYKIVTQLEKLQKDLPCILFFQTLKDNDVLLYPIDSKAEWDEINSELEKLFSVIHESVQKSKKKNKDVEAELWKRLKQYNFMRKTKKIAVKAFDLLADTIGAILKKGIEAGLKQAGG